VKVKVYLSAIMGFFFALTAYILLLWLKIPYAFLFSALSGLLFYILLFAFLLLHEKVMNRKYAEAEKSITSPVFFKTNGNFNLGSGKIKNGNIYFCEAGIVFICLDEKPYASDEILLQDIEKYQFDDIHLNIFTRDGRLFVITMPEVRKVMDILKEKEWAEF